MKNSQSGIGSALLTRGAAPQEKENEMRGGRNESRDEATALTQAQTATSGETTANLMYSSDRPLRAYKEGVGEGITEHTEDASCMDPESAMMQSHGQYSSSELRKGSGL